MKQIQREAISHYDRMIKYAQTQDSLDMPDQEQINWHGWECSYCARYSSDRVEERKCIGCPLSKDGIAMVWGSKNCCAGLWSKMDRALTWKTWLKYARLVRQYIIDNG
jgi:hypothetical protein